MFLTARLAEKNNPTINYCFKHVTIFFGYYDPVALTTTIDIYISYNISIIWLIAMEMETIL